MIAQFVLLIALGLSLGAHRPAALAVIPTAIQQEAKVWVNARSGVYHCPGSRYWLKTMSGVLMSEATAIAKGNRPANGRACGLTAPAAQAESTARKPALATVVAPTAGAGVRVWVNLGSGVFHCPGTRYYGKTKSGEYMTQAAARSAGYRPAQGADCP